MLGGVDWVSSSYCADKWCVEVAWQRSSACSGGNCVEAGFVKSTACAGGECVEAACGGVHHDEVRVRDSKNPDGPVLLFTRAEWDAFIKGAKAGEFD